MFNAGNHPDGTVRQRTPYAVQIRNIALAWVLTLPAAMILSGSLYWLFSHLF
jgi:phosphate/sulfate permease